MKMMDDVDAESVIQHTLQYQRCGAPSETSISFEQTKESSLHSTAGTELPELAATRDYGGDSKGIRQIQGQQVYMWSL